MLGFQGTPKACLLHKQSNGVIILGDKSFASLALSASSTFSKEAIARANLDVTNSPAHKDCQLLMSFLVVQACNPTYSGDRNWKAHGSRPA
jgi:hypothetical protein